MSAPLPAFPPAAGQDRPAATNHSQQERDR